MTDLETSELTSLRKLAAQVRRMRMTAPVEDDFSDVMYCMWRQYDRYIRHFGEPHNILTPEDILTVENIE